MMAALEAAERRREERERALREDCVIWCRKYGQWWGPDRRGYTPSLAHAGIYSRAEAERHAEDGVDQVRPIFELIDFAPNTVGRVLLGDRP